MSENDSHLHSDSIRSVRLKYTFLSVCFGSIGMLAAFHVRVGIIARTHRENICECVLDLCVYWPKSEHAHFLQAVEVEPHLRRDKSKVKLLHTPQKDYRCHCFTLNLWE